MLKSTKTGMRHKVTFDLNMDKISFFTRLTSYLLSVEFHQPDKQGCHQLTVRENGLYTFGTIELNEANRDLNRRYCKFATDGSAWTVIQRRELLDLQENFNRSWNEYKNGFGDLSYEFWFGNNFIHM